MFENGHTELPSPMPLVHRLVELCADKATKRRDVLSILAMDAARSAELLRAANMAPAGQPGQVASLSGAAEILNFASIRTVALSFHLAELSQRWSRLGLDLNRHWQGNLLRACLARQIVVGSPLFTAEAAEPAYIVGLLQDFAVPIVADAVGPEYAGFVQGIGLYTTAARAEKERTAAGIDHAAAAAELLRAWNVPEPLPQILEVHHQEPDFDRAEEAPEAFRHIAWFVGLIQFNDDQQTASVDDQLREFAKVAFELSEKRLSHTFYRAIEDYLSLRPFITEALPDGTDAQTLLTRAQQLALGDQSA